MRHGFRDGLGPFEHRPVTAGQDLPTDPDCAVVRDGRLRLRVRDNPLRTGMVHAPSWEFTHGFLEARLRFQGPFGAHGAGWLRPASTDAHEVDYAEHFGGRNVQHVVWAGPDWRTPTRVFHAGTPVDDGWHVYGIDAHESGYTFTMDDTTVARTDFGPTGPMVPVFSVLSDEWERRDTGGLLPHPAKDYGLLVDWVRLDS
jgi:hypothetical protein